MKQLSICRSPNILVIQLKRFSFGGSIGKITKPIGFELNLNIQCNNLTSGSVEKVPYGLIGIVVHHGTSIHSGHYVAFVKVRTYMCAYTCMCVNAFVYVCMYVCIYVRAHIFVYVCMRVRTYVFIYVYTYECTESAVS